MIPQPEICARILDEFRLCEHCDRRRERLFQSPVNDHWIFAGMDFYHAHIDTEGGTVKQGRKGAVAHNHRAVAYKIRAQHEKLPTILTLIPVGSRFQLRQCPYRENAPGAPVELVITVFASFSFSRLVLTSGNR